MSHGGVRLGEQGRQFQPEGTCEGFNLEKKRQEKKNPLRGSKARGAVTLVHSCTRELPVSISGKLAKQSPLFSLIYSSKVCWFVSRQSAQANFSMLASRLPTSFPLLGTPALKGAGGKQVAFFLTDTFPFSLCVAYWRRTEQRYNEEVSARMTYDVSLLLQCAPRERERERESRS